MGSEAQFGAERLRNCARFDLFDLKGYSEQMNSLAVLYPLADPSFFRVRCFQQLATQQYVYNDGRDTGLGHYASREDLKQGISESQKRKTMDVEKDVLYYFIGGEMHRGTEQTIDDAKYFLQNIVCNAEHENVALLARMQGIELPPREPNPNPSPDDAHCQELEEQFNKA